MMGLLEKNLTKAARFQSIPTALCISEDPQLLNQLRKALEQQGFIVIVTSDPEEVAVLMDNHQLQLVICDNELTGTDGLAVFDRLKTACGSTPAPPTLLLAPKTSSSLVSRCAKSGISALQSRTSSVQSIIDRAVSCIPDPELRSDIESVTRGRDLRMGSEKLTVVASRKKFLERFAAELKAANRARSSISMLALRVDRFDSLELRTGATRLESALAHVELIIRGELRSRDYVGRYADDVFAIVLPDTDHGVARAIGERLRRLTAATIFGTFDAPIRISFLAQVATRTPETYLSMEDMLSRAGVSFPRTVSR